MVQHGNDIGRMAVRLCYIAIQTCIHWLIIRRLTGMGIPIINLRRSDDRLMFMMGIPCPIRLCLLNEKNSSCFKYNTLRCPSLTAVINMRHTGKRMKHNDHDEWILNSNLLYEKTLSLHMANIQIVTYFINTELQLLQIILPCPINGINRIYTNIHLDSGNDIDVTNTHWIECKPGLTTVN